MLCFLLHFLPHRLPFPCLFLYGRMIPLKMMGYILSWSNWCDYTDFTELCLFTQVANFSHQFKSIQIYIIGNSTTFFSIANKLLKKKPKKKPWHLLNFGDQYFRGCLLLSYVLHPAPLFIKGSSPKPCEPQLSWAAEWASAQEWTHGWICLLTCSSVPFPSPQVMLWTQPIPNVRESCWGQSPLHYHSGSHTGCR